MTLDAPTVDVRETQEASDVTVVIPTIPGREHLLDRAVDSVWQQTLRPATIIVVRDVDRRGAWWARNRGLELVRTTWTAWLDDDDEFKSNHLEALREGVDDPPGYDMAYSYMEIVGDARDPLAVAYEGRLVRPLGVPFGPEQERHLRERGNFIPVTYLARTDLVRRVGGMPEPWSPQWPRDCEDYGLLVRMLDAGARFVHVPERTWRYHIHDENVGGAGLGKPQDSGGASPTAWQHGPEAPLVDPPT